MRENRTSGSVQGVPGNGRSYCENGRKKAVAPTPLPLLPLLLDQNLYPAVNK